MKKQFYVVKLDHSRVSYLALVSKTNTNVTMLTGNAAFATPSPTLAALTAASKSLAEAVEAYNFTRSRVDKEARDQAFTNLKELRALLGAYVQNTSQGVQELITSAGFETEKSRQPIGQLPAPMNVRAAVRPYPGSLEVRFDGVKGRLVYEVSICSGDPKVEKDWTLYTSTGKTRVVVDGLESNATYFFRVVALGAAGASPVSDVAAAKAA